MGEHDGERATCRHGSTDTPTLHTYTHTHGLHGHGHTEPCTYMDTWMPGRPALGTWDLHGQGSHTQVSFHPPGPYGEARRTAESEKASGNTCTIAFCFAESGSMSMHYTTTCIYIVPWSASCICLPLPLLLLLPLPSAAHRVRIRIRVRVRVRVGRPFPPSPPLDYPSLAMYCRRVILHMHARPLLFPLFLSKPRTM